MTYLPRLRELEQKILREHGRPKHPIIAIGGWTGTGKDTAATNLQKLLEKDGTKLKVHVASDVFRAAARKAGYSERELEKFNIELTTKGSHELDLAIDRTLLETALTEGGIFVGRLAPAVVGEHGIKIWIQTDPKVIAERVTKDPARKEHGMDKSELARRIADRDRTDAARYKDIYGVDPEELKRKYDLVVDNSKLTKEQLARMVYEFVKVRLKELK